MFISFGNQSFSLLFSVFILSAIIETDISNRHESSPAFCLFVLNGLLIDVNRALRF